MIIAFAHSDDTSFVDYFNGCKINQIWCPTIKIPVAIDFAKKFNCQIFIDDKLDFQSNFHSYNPYRKSIENWEQENSDLKIGKSKIHQFVEQICCRNTLVIANHNVIEMLLNYTNYIMFPLPKKSNISIVDISSNHKYLIKLGDTNEENH